MASVISNLYTRLNLPHISFATVEHGARRLDDRTVSHNGIGMLTIAPGRGDDSLFNLIEQANSDGFPVSCHTDANHILYAKSAY